MINNDTAPYVFKINGVVHHRIGTLLPQRGTQPKFAQLYTYDKEHETQNRLGIFETDDAAAGQLDPEMVSSLLDMLNENNSLVKAFRCAREHLEREDDQKITLRLLGCNTRHDVQYNLPSNGEIAAIIVGDYTTGEYTYDVLVHDRECGLKCVSCLHPAYMPLQYPLLFPYGEHGFHLGIRTRWLMPFVLDGLCFSGGSPCKWYINPDVPEEGALMASAMKAHSPIKWNEVLSSNQPMSHVPKEQKIAYIRDLHPFENKDREFLVTVTVKKIGDRWWYNACKKCTRTAVAHGDSYKCSDQVCANIGTPSQRYKLLLAAGDETGDIDFILFGRMAQRIIKKPCDMLIVNNPIDFIPDPITDLLEKTYIWNVSFSDHTINTGNICFQVNAVVAEIGTAKDFIQASSSRPKQSQPVLLQDAPSGVEDTPNKASNLVMPSTPLTPQSSATSVQDKTFCVGSSTMVPGAIPAITKELTSTPRKRTRSSPSKTVTKRLFTDIDGGITGSKDVADSAAAPSPTKDA
ncbi:hypothetical protein ZEAMMB73_Zm00001d008773 [Zea mays]|uniref:Replication factor A C-terminal domain-containing protein n=3 Tax=Zea mays TaxID=4577 RepID=A0A1D6FFE0_MAIZE|nr:hypothetical protein ZEAMMB73_Zm00001d008773 [Zea mays]